MHSSALQKCTREARWIFRHGTIKRAIDFASKLQHRLRSLNFSFQGNPQTVSNSPVLRPRHRRTGMLLVVGQHLVLARRHRSCDWRRELSRAIGWASACVRVRAASTSRNQLGALARSESGSHTSTPSRAGPAARPPPHAGIVVAVPGPAAGHGALAHPAQIIPVAAWWTGPERPARPLRSSPGQGTLLCSFQGPLS